MTGWNAFMVLGKGATNRFHPSFRFLASSVTLFSDMVTSFCLFFQASLITLAMHCLLERIWVVYNLFTVLELCSGPFYNGAIRE